MKLELEIKYAIRQIYKTSKIFLSNSESEFFNTFSVSSSNTLTFDNASDALAYMEQNNLSFSKYQIYPFVYIPANLHVREDLTYNEKL